MVATLHFICRGGRGMELPGQENDLQPASGLSIIESLIAVSLAIVHSLG